MRKRKWAIAALAVAVPASFTTVVPAAVAAPKSPAPSGDGRYLAVANSDADYGGLKADVRKAGGLVVEEMPEVKALVVRAPKSAKSKLEASSHAAGVATDRLIAVSPPETKGPLTPNRSVTKVSVSGLGPPVTPDPAYFQTGLMWNLNRIGMVDAFRKTVGSSDVTVGVADTGLDYTHAELADKVVHVQDFSDHRLCKSISKPPTSDADLAKQTGGPVDGDFNGHGSWIGGNIAANLDGVGINGIAPKVNLVSLKISEWCGFANDSELLNAFIWAANNGVDVVSISFGGYTDRSDPDQNLIYELYAQVVSFAKRRGTVIVASAGNEHVRVGAGGEVLTHGQLTTPGATAGAPDSDFPDLFGLFETPGGLPGVVDVSSTGNIVNASSPSCDFTGGRPANATCKPLSDAHQQAGVGLENQLAYYSDYGPRIDVAGPGGARKFNLPVWDGGGTPGFPYTTDDGTAAFEDFSITSNFAQQIPCFVFEQGNGVFYPDQCYTSIQGTSMATPHVSATLALIASAQPDLQGNVDALVAKLKDSAEEVHGNTTQPVSATDTSAGDQSGLACTTGVCHLGGDAISDADAYGAGLVDAARAVGAKGPHRAHVPGGP
jgi:subtilisin family serine protease